jgi:hypothetical protein
LDFDNGTLPAKVAIYLARYRLGPYVMREAAEQTLKPSAPLEASETWHDGMRLLPRGVIKIQTNHHKVKSMKKDIIVIIRRGNNGN